MSGTLRGCILHCVAPGEGERDCSQPGLKPGIAGLVGKPHSFTGPSCTHGVGQSNSWHHSSSSGLAGLSPDSRFNPDGISTQSEISPKDGISPKASSPQTWAQPSKQQVLDRCLEGSGCCCATGVLVSPGGGKLFLTPSHGAAQTCLGTTLQTWPFGERAWIQLPSILPMSHGTGLAGLVAADENIQGHR